MYPDHHHCYSLWIMELWKTIPEPSLGRTKKRKSGSQEKSSKPTSATEFLCDLADQFSGKKGMTTMPLFSRASSDRALKKKPLWTTRFLPWLHGAHATCHSLWVSLQRQPSSPTSALGKKEFFKANLPLQDQRQRVNCKSIIEFKETPLVPIFFEKTSLL